VQRVIRSIKRLFRDISRYAREHPVKVFLMVIVPLITSGVLVKLLAMIGLRLPQGILSALGGGAHGARGSGDVQGLGYSQGISGLISLAKMFN